MSKKACVCRPAPAAASFTCRWNWDNQTQHFCFSDAEFFDFQKQPCVLIVTGSQTTAMQKPHTTRCRRTSKESGQESPQTEKYFDLKYMFPNHPISGISCWTSLGKESKFPFPFRATICHWGPTMCLCLGSLGLWRSWKKPLDKDMVSKGCA